MKPVFGRIFMCFLISGHTSNVSFNAVLHLSSKRYDFISITLRNIIIKAQSVVKTKNAGFSSTRPVVN